MGDALETPNENKISYRRSAARPVPVGLRVCSTGRDARSLLADGMGLGVGEVELDGRRGRSFRLSSDGTGKRQNQTTEAQYRQGLERCSGVNPRLKAER